MNDLRTDHELVTAHLQGDRTALAGIYDRYADSLYDTAAAMLRDRHEAADVMQDVFVVAAQRVGQLRDPRRLRAWLFAILRNEVYRRTKRRSRSLPVDFSAPGVADVAAPIDSHGEGERIAERELADMVRTAAAGLDPRDQLVLELSVRQGLAGADLADALGVTAEQSHMLVHRMRDRVERSIGALTVARMGRQDCDDLARLLAGWDGTFSVLIRKRVARHVDSCELCDRTRRRYAVIPLMSVAPALAAPAGLRELILQRAGTGSGSHRSGSHRSGSPRQHFDTEHGFPSVVRPSRRLLIVAAAIVLVLAAVGGVGMALAMRDDDGSVAVGSDQLPSATSVPTAETAEPAASSPQTTTAPDTTPPPTTSPTTSAPSTTASPTTAPSTTAPSTTAEPTTVPSTAPPTAPPVVPGQLVASSGLLDLGDTATVSTVVLTNTGGTAVDWRIDGEAPPFIWSTTAGSLLPEQSIEVQLGIDRSVVAEGNVSRSFSLVSSGQGSGLIEARAVVERAPVVTIVRSSSTISCPWSVEPLVAATVADESTVPTVDLSWTGPGRPGNVAMTTPGSGQWSGRLGISRVNGTWRWVVTATDNRGNQGTASGTIVVTGC